MLALTRCACCAGTACKPYAALFEEGAWRELAELFRKDLYRLHSMPLESQLSIHLQVTKHMQPNSYQGQMCTSLKQLPCIDTAGSPGNTSAQHVQ